MARTSKSTRSQMSPRKSVAIGDRFVLGGVTYEVVPRGEVAWPREACMGCAFAARNCPENLACSSFDRRDGISVWFKEK